MLRGSVAALYRARVWYLLGVDPDTEERNRDTAPSLFDDW